MGYTFVGNDPVNRANYQGAGNTFIDLTTPATSRGILKAWSVFLYDAAGNFKVKVFRDDGTNYIFIGESPSTPCAIGANNNLPCWIPIEKGDLIGVYADQAFDCGVTANQVKYKAGDVTTTTPKTDWSSTVGPISLQGKIFSRTTLL